MRLTRSMMYSGGKMLYDNCRTTQGLTDVISRLGNISETGQTLEIYQEAMRGRRSFLAPRR